MKNYIVSARKYRPSSFDSVVGQQALTTTLKNAILGGKLAHAYLFCGPRGVGKTTCARIFAKTINCMNLTPKGDACNACESCLAFDEHRSYNIHELDAASNNSVEDIKVLMEQVRIPPQIGQYKVFIIDEVHMLSTSAFNAFLKTLEEPPKHAIFILATTEKHKILPTILSRCQIYDFNRMGVEEIVGHLQYVASQEGITADPEALNVIAQKADGGMRDALSIFDQVSSYTQGHITYKGVIEDLNVLDYEYYFRLTDLFLDNEVSEILLTFDEILRKGFDASHFINGLSNHLRDLLVSRDAATVKLLEVSPSVRQRYQEQAAKCAQQFLYRAMKLCNACDLNYRTSNNKRFLIELALIQIAQLTAPETEDGESSGLRPTQLKPIFNPHATSAQTPVQQPTPPAVPATQAATTPSNPVHTTASASGPAPEERTAPAATAQSPQGYIPPVQAAAAEKKLPRMGKDMPGLSIKRIQQEVQETTAKNGTGASDQTSQAPPELQANSLQSPVTEVDLSMHWRGFAHSLPQEQKALQQRMYSMSLLLLDEQGTFEVLADNPMIMTDLNQIRPQVEHYLRTQLCNPQIQMKIRVRNDVEKKEIPLTQGERFQKMMEKNPAIRELKDNLGLELD